MIALTFILQFVIGIIAAFIIFFLISNFKSKSSTEQSIDQQITLSEWVVIAVIAAGQIYPGSGRGEEKKSYVIEFLIAKGYAEDADSISIEIDAMIESTVSALKNGGIS